jgi:hypothetical protein
LRRPAAPSFFSFSGTAVPSACGSDFAIILGLPFQVAYRPLRCRGRQIIVERLLPVVLNQLIPSAR